ncbi:hypothetical protein EW093_09925 [Thiospirochaeta perfilievii]|uniref:SH3b domain-containing protein n=1 Tax=Thiospirochaeta perfilievii TaxID=252967 RepID=A0A5C1QA48_9SPIO|nr:BatD family protein [Thiospirochaeta perfilievii]QEN05013.1 hypothetical protein EW093_09925 [Thiospirochaeta perfilievii]
MGIKLPGRRVRKRLVALLLLLLSSSLFGQEMSVLPDILITGRVITLKIQTDFLYSENIEVGELELPDELSLISGPIVRPYRKRVDGKNQMFNQITWALRSKESGVYTIPNAEIYVKEKLYSVEVPLIKIFNNDERFNNYPLIVEWNKNIKKTIFVGESLPLVVEAYNLEEINFPDRVVTNNPRKGEIVEVSGLGDINPERVGEADLYRVPVASWIYTPFEAGMVTIPSVRVEINGLTRYTGSLEVEVLPVKDLNETGGVGEFLISTEISESQVTPEDMFHYKVRVSGQGNLPYFKFPEIKYDNLILIDKSENESISYTDNGYLGWREIDLTLQALDSGVKEIALSEVSWIDKNGSEIFYNGSISHLNVVSVKIVSEDIMPFLSFMKTPEIISSYRMFLYKNPLMWLFLGFSGLFYIIISLFKSIKKNRGKKGLLMTIAIMPLFLTSAIFAKGFEYQGELVAADKYIDSGDFESALVIYNDLSEKLPYNWGIFVNKSILWDKLDNVANSIYNIRLAERIAPTNSKIKQIKLYLSDSEESSQKQAKTSNGVNPDYIFIILLIFFNLLVLVLIRLLRVKSVTTYSMLFLTLLFSLLSVIMLIFIHSKNRVDAGIISQGGAPLTKVPNEMALDWMTLGEGNCVYIKGEWKDDYLIETEYGLQGWVSKDTILVLEER